jgi:predicted GIY-YIG superfamily endonuclease
MRDTSKQKNSGTVYLIHFNRAYKHAKHYLGFTENLDKRLTDHLAGMGARLMEVVTEARIEWKVSRTWSGDRKVERRLKNWHNAALLCPLCSGKQALSRGNFAQKIQRFAKRTR